MNQREQAKEEKKTAIRIFAEEYIKCRHSSPSMSEIASALGIHKSTVWRYLKEMNAQRLLQYSGDEVVTRTTEKVDMEQVSIPLAGSIPCGTPEEQEGSIEVYYSFPRAMFGKGEFFMLRAAGDSMVDVGIESGDLVIVRRETEARNGQIVAALTENSSTLKTYVKENENARAYLHPENRAAGYEDIYRDFEIQGVAVKVIKDL